MRICELKRLQKEDVKFKARRGPRTESLAKRQICTFGRNSVHLPQIIYHSSAQQSFSRPISSDLQKLSPKLFNRKENHDGSKSLQLLQTLLLHRTHQPPACLWKDSICPLEMKHPACSTHPPQSYFSALMSLPPAAGSSAAGSSRAYTYITHSSRTFLRKNVSGWCFSSATGADLRAAGVLSDQSQDKGLSKALPLKEMRVLVFNSMPWLQNLSLFRMLGRSGWAVCFRKTLKSFPLCSSTCIASRLQLMLQSGESLRTFPEKSHSLASTFSIANLSLSFHKISYCSHAQSWFRCYLFYR